MRGGGILYAHVFMGVFSLFAVSFAQVLCYNIKLTDYAISVNDVSAEQPRHGLLDVYINHNRPNS